MASFHELNLPVAVGDIGNVNLTETVNKVNSLVKLGYEVIAFNILHTFTAKKQNKKKKQKGNQDGGDQVLQFDPRKFVIDVVSHIKPKPKGFKLLSRVTAVLEDQLHVRELQSPYIQSFDILAVRPTNEKLFHQACKEMEVDLISIEMEESRPFRVKFSSVGMASERGIHFEIYYAPAIRSHSTCKQVLRSGIEIVKNSKGKNVILSSNADSYMEMRGPYDIANLGLLFGLTENQARAAISKNCESVVLHAFGRKQTAKSVLSITKLDVTKPSEVQEKEKIHDRCNSSDEESLEPERKKKKSEH